MGINSLIERKKHECKDKDCSKMYYKYKSTDKYCSFSCKAKNTKKPIMTHGFVHKLTKPKVIDWDAKYKKDKELAKKRKTKKNKLSDFEKEFIKAKVKVKKRVIEEYGQLVCERCRCKSSIQFSVHHIIYRSEEPKHKMLNNILNLIYLCYDCHESFHKVKRSRNYLIQKLNLTKLFGNIWGYDSDIKY
jgi:5-methylcytosine-specific restriction endonuclease McrA